MRFLYIIPTLILIISLNSCASESYLYQKQIPTSEVALNNLLDTVPAFRSAFSKVDIPTFNKKLSDFLYYDQETSVFVLNALVYLMKGEPQLPMMLDDASGILQQILDYYDSPQRVEQLTAFGNMLEQSKNIDPFLAIETTQTLLKKLSRITQSIATNSGIFQTATSRDLQPFSTWQDCSIKQTTFEANNKKLSDSIQNTMQDIYTLTRNVNCMITDIQKNPTVERFIGKDGMYRKPEVTMEDLMGIVGGLDLEPMSQEGIDFLVNNKQDLLDYEHIAADWLGANKEKNQLTNLFIQVIYPLLISAEKHQTMLSAKDIADHALGFLLQRYPNSTRPNGEDKYLISSLIDAAYKDLLKLKNLKNLINIDLNHPFYNNSIKLLTDSGYGASAIFKSGAFEKNTFKTMLTGDEVIYQSYVTDKKYTKEGVLTSAVVTLEDTSLTGMLKNSFFNFKKGLLIQLNNITAGTNYGYNQFREFIASKYSNSIFVSKTYNNEGLYEAIVKDLYYSTMSKFHDGDKWIATRDDVSNDDQGNLMNYGQNLIYSIVNLFLMNADGNYPSFSSQRTLTASQASTISLTPDASYSQYGIQATKFFQSDNAPFMTKFMYTLGGALGVMDPKEGPPVQTMATSMHASENNDISVDGVQTTPDDTIGNVDTVVFCKPGVTVNKLPGVIRGGLLPGIYQGYPKTRDNSVSIGYEPIDTCHIINKTTYRGGKPWLVTYDMPAYEMLTPGRFISKYLEGDNKNNLSKSYQDPILKNSNGDSNIKLIQNVAGKFTQHQGDLVSTNAETTAWVMSQFQNYAWKGYGPYTVNGKSAGGSKLKYQNDFYTDSYKNVICKEGATKEVKEAQGFTASAMYACAATGIFAPGCASVVSTINWVLLVASEIGQETWEEGAVVESSNQPAGEVACPKNRQRFSPLGANGRTILFSSSEGGDDAGMLPVSNDNRNTKANEGAVHMYESIYRPLSANDPCWGDATENGRYSYARYGYLRPSGGPNVSDAIAQGYANNANCTLWTKIQVDFDNAERTIASNLDWVINYKKHVMVTPTSGYNNIKVASDYNGASLSMYNIVVGNGVAGVVKGGLAGTVKNGCKGGDNTSTSSTFCNGVWQSYLENNSYFNMMDTDTDSGHIPNYDSKVSGGKDPITGKISKNGFVVEHNSAALLGIKQVIRFGRTSFKAGDAALMVDFTVQAYGLGGGEILDVAKDYAKKFFIPFYEPDANELHEFLKQRYTFYGKKTFSSINRSVQNYSKALQPLLSLPAKYNLKEIIVTNTATSSTFEKFQPFFHLFFPTDDYNALGNVGADGQLDILQKYKRSLNANGSPNNCLLANKMRKPYCLTAKEMPIIPRVTGVSYPHTYNTNGGVASWKNADHTDYKFESFLGLLIPMVSTFFTSGEILDCNGNKVFSKANLDDICIQQFNKDGFRARFKDFLVAVLVMNESRQILKTDGTPALEMEYNPKALMNLLAETAPGKRDGLIFRALGMFNVANIPSITEDITSLVQNNYQSVLNNFNMLSKTKGGTVSYYDQLRYFLSNKPIQEHKFVSNNLGNRTPAMFVKDTLNFTKTVVNDPDLYYALTTGFDSINSYLKVHTDSKPLSLSSHNIKPLLNSVKSTLDGFVVPNYLNSGKDKMDYFTQDLLEDFLFSKILDNLDNVEALADINNIKKLDQTFDLNIRKMILGYLLGDGPCGYDQKYDFNQNGKYDEGLLILSVSVYNNCQLPADSTIYSDPLYGSPNYLNPRYYHLDIDRIAKGITSFLNDINTSDLNALVDTLYRANTVNIPQMITEIKNNAIDNAMKETKISEIQIDLNENGIVDDNEYVDINKNGKYDSFVLEEGIDYAIEQGANYLENKGGFYALKPDYLRFLNIADELLNPYNEACKSNQNAPECNYILGTVFEAKQTYLNMFTFNASDLLAAKMFAGNWLFDQNTGEYTNFSLIAHHRVPSMISVFQGKMHDLIKWSAYGFKPDGFLTYMMSTLKVDNQQYSTIDFIRDLKTLLNTKAMREYNNPNTFWWQFASLTESFGAYVAKEKNIKWKQDEDFHSQVSNIFK